MDGDDEQQIQVSFESGFNKLELVPYDAFVRYGGICNVIRCTTAKNGKLLVYGPHVVAACTEKQGKFAVDILGEVSLSDCRLKHGGAALVLIAKEVVCMFCLCMQFLF
jgi:hypothetical protein